MSFPRPHTTKQSDGSAPETRPPRSTTIKTLIGTGANPNVAAQNEMRVRPLHSAAAVGDVASGRATGRKMPGTVGASATSLILARMDDGTLPRLSALVESSLTRGASTGFARLEIAERVREELTIILNPDGSHQHLVDYHRMNVSQVAAGYLFSRMVGRAAIGLGARGAVSFIPRRMEPIYRSRHPTNFSLYANLHPAAPHQHH